jgi:hypothetical protein
MATQHTRKPRFPARWTNLSRDGPGPLPIARAYHRPSLIFLLPRRIRTRYDTSRFAICDVWMLRERRTGPRIVMEHT